MKRKLITGERLMYIDASTPLNVVLTVKIRGSIAPGTLQAALAKVQRKHPFLRVKISEGEDGFPYFVTSDTIREIPVQIMDRNNDEDWKAQNVLEWKELFNVDDAPMARVVWLKGAEVSELILVCAHCICDGKSIVTLMSEILLLMDRPETKLSAYPLFGSVEELLSEPYTVSQVMKGERAAAAFRKLFHARPEAPQPSAEHNYLLHWKFDATITKRLIEQCRKNGTTVHAALCVIFLDAFRAVKGSSASGIVRSPVDIRNLIPQIKEDMMFAMAPSVTLSADPGIADFWMKAKIFKTELMQKIEALNGAEMLVVDEYLPVDIMINGMRRSSGIQDFMLSNLGRLNIAAHYRSFDIETIYGPTAAFPFASPTAVVVSTFEDEIDFSLCSNHPYLHQQSAAQICEKVKELVAKNIS